ncbi:TetR/AcrR family transcriptional regulator [Gordonia araii]|uniref:TetR/AcrR family transcriptional regulator n=1 Tax=Gordonia araii TaxID=263909 RepID=UPI0002DE74B7|nr:TetR family transcriptional regulator [Gordonia araii]NNG95706.1 TetR family transcriptional regulator [Gordonia araii NBRC 100433]
MTRRDEVLDAAIRALGEHGLYGLTHRKVDRAAGLPEGTTSNYFRTRAKLLTGAVDHLVATEFDVWNQGGAAELTTADDLVELATRFVEWALTEGRTRSVARIALLEAAITEPDVAEVLRAARRQVEVKAAELCSPLGLDSTGTAVLLDATDSITFRQLAIPAPDFGPRAYFERLIGALTTGG